jgi:hypothetical protein
MKVTDRKQRWGLMGLLYLILAAVLVLPQVIGISAVNGLAAPVEIGSACNFAILAYAGISDVPTSAITGDIGVTPTTGASIGVTCPEMLTGIIYDVNGAYTNASCLVTNASLLGTAMGAAGAAYTDALSRATDVLNAGNGAGEIGGLTLVPGASMCSYQPISPSRVVQTMYGYSRYQELSMYTRMLSWVAAPRQRTSSGQSLAQQLFSRALLSMEIFWIGQVLRCSLAQH